MKYARALAVVLLGCVAAACTAPAADNTQTATPSPTPATAQITPPPTPQTETPQQLTTEELVGTLDIDAGPPPALNYLGGPEPKVGWVFINGGLLGKMPFRQQRLLVPGTYEIRAVLAHDSAYGVKYWTVFWPRVKVERGKTESIKTQQVIDGWLTGGWREDGVEFHESPTPQMQPASFALDENSARRLEEAWDDLGRKWKSYLDSDDWKAVAAAADHLRLSPPSRPRVWVELPASLGGPREFDAEQLRLLSKFLAPDLGGWASPAIFIPTDSPLTEDEQRRLRAMVERLTERNREQRQYVEGVLKGMIAALDKVPEE
ncbi:MAG TPA: hypothetical protein VFS10_16390 [Pyrinomonadaceae bacterium]|nr:hypothetical protein [Pyrinomonadaceae bacterium]